MLIDWFTVAAQIVNFLILVALLKYFLYGRIVRAMDARERQIAARLEAAEQQRQEAAEVSAAYRHKHRALDEQRAALLVQARADADAQRQEWLDNARTEVERLHARWQEAIQHEQDAFLHDLRQRASQQMYATVRRALTDLAHADLEQQMIVTFLQELQGLDATAWEALTASPQDAQQPLVIYSAFEFPRAARQQLHTILCEHLGDAVQLRFETAPEVVCGIELRTDGQKMAWNLEHYLSALEESLAAAFTAERQETRGARGPAQAAASGHPREGEDAHATGA